VPAELFPYDLCAEANDHRMTLSWKVEGERLISGYNIYLSEASQGRVVRGSDDENVRPFNAVPFPGDTEPEDGVQHYIAEPLENGVRYAVRVRALFPDGSLSQPSNEVAAVCGPRGELTLAVRYKADNDGYSFELNRAVRANSVDNDLYFFSDAAGDYLASPDRLGGFINRSRFAVLPFRGDFVQVSARLADFELNPSEDRVAVKPGDWVLVRTQRDTFALVNVLGFEGAGESRSARLSFAYSTIVGEAVF